MEPFRFRSQYLAQLTSQLDQLRLTLVGAISLSHHLTRRLAKRFKDMYVDHCRFLTGTRAAEDTREEGLGLVQVTLAVLSCHQSFALPWMTSLNSFNPSSANATIFPSLSPPKPVSASLVDVFFSAATASAT